MKDEGWQEVAISTIEMSTLEFSPLRCLGFALRARRRLPLRPPAVPARILLCFCKPGAAEYVWVHCFACGGRQRTLGVLGVGVRVCTRLRPLYPSCTRAGLLSKTP